MGSIISNQDLDGGAYTTVVVKWYDEVEGYGENIDAPLCGGLYKKEKNYIIYLVRNRSRCQYELLHLVKRG